MIDFWPPRPPQSKNVIEATGLVVSGPTHGPFSAMKIELAENGQYQLEMELPGRPAFYKVDSDVRILGFMLSFLDEILPKLILRAAEEGYGTRKLKRMAMDIHNAIQY